MNKEMLISDIMYNDTSIEYSEASQMASTMEKNFNSFSLYDVENTIACDLSEEDLLFLEAMEL